jgi:hypothetical protein
MKTYGGMQVYLHYFLTFGTRFRRVASFTPWPFYLKGNSSLHKFDNELGRLQSQSELVGEGINQFPAVNLIEIFQSSSLINVERSLSPVIFSYGQQYTSYTINIILQ